MQVVQERVPLRRAGVAWKGLCPFHGEKTPSFNVNEDDGLFHCFGCGVGGDVIKFVELHEKIRFPDAVRQLAARVGLTVPEAGGLQGGSRAGQREREALLKVHEVAAAFFREQLQAPGGRARRAGCSRTRQSDRGDDRAARRSATRRGPETDSASG